MLNNLVQAIVPLVEQENVVTQAPNVPVLQGKQPLTSSDLSSKYKQKAGKPTSSDGITTQLSPHHKIPQIKSPPPPVYHLTIDCRGGGKLFIHTLLEAAVIQQSWLESSTGERWDGITMYTWRLYTWSDGLCMGEGGGGYQWNFMVFHQLHRVRISQIRTNQKMWNHLHVP